VIKDQTQSHLHSQQVNAKSTSSSARGPPVLHLATTTEDLRAPSRSPTQRALQVYLTGCIANRHSKRPQLKTYEHPAGPPHNGLTSSPYQRFVATGPLQGQQLPACVHVIAAENIGDSTWVSRTFDIPQGYLRACHKLFGHSSGREIGSFCQLFPLMCSPAVQCTSPQANKSQREPTQITADSRNGDCCYAHIPCSAIDYSHSCVGVPF
jgi:hypothetical protein